MKKSTTLLLTFALVFFAACGGNSTRTGEDYGDLFDSPGGLTLDVNKHPHGWGKSDCTACHNLYNIHLGDDSEEGFDMAAVRELVSTEGISVCSRCHGTNGVTQ